MIKIAELTTADLGRSVLFAQTETGTLTGWTQKFLLVQIEQTIVRCDPRYCMFNGDRLPAQNSFDVKTVETPEDAPNYNRDTLDIRGAVIDRVVIVKRGTVCGKPTVDVVFKSEDGCEFVAMTTGALLVALADIIKQTGLR